MKKNGRVKLNVSSKATNYTVSYLGNLISLARKEHGISQLELSDRTGLNCNLIKRIESGNLQVSIGNVFEVCFVLGIPLMGCDEKHINNLSKMLSFMNKMLPDKTSCKKDSDLVDDF